MLRIIATIVKNGTVKKFVLPIKCPILVDSIISDNPDPKQSIIVVEIDEQIKLNTLKTNNLVFLI